MTTIFGEFDKWVPMSPQRVSKLTWTDDVIAANLQGASNESFTMWYMFKSKVDSVTCNLDSSGEGSLEINGKLGHVTCAV